MRVGEGVIGSRAMVDLHARILELLESGDLFDPNEEALSRHAKARYVEAALKTELVCAEWLAANPGAAISDGAIAETFKRALQ